MQSNLFDRVATHSNRQHQILAEMIHRDFNTFFLACNKKVGLRKQVVHAHSQGYTLSVVYLMHVAFIPYSAVSINKSLFQQKAQLNIKARTPILLCNKYIHTTRK